MREKTCFSQVELSSTGVHLLSLKVGNNKNRSRRALEQENFTDRQEILENTWL